MFELRFQIEFNSAWVAKLVDAQDLKSWAVNNGVPVRFRP
jgi:hypothetical protein